MPAGELKPPGPQVLPFLGNSFMAHGDPLATVTAWARKYGDVVYYRFFGLPVYLLVHPRDIELVLLTKAGSLSKGLVSRSTPELFGNGLLTSEGEFWRRQRRLSNPAFHRERIAQYSEITIDEAECLMSRWKTGEVRNVHEDMMNVTLRIVLRSLFGRALRETTTRLIGRALGSVMQSTSGIHAVVGHFLRIPTPARHRYLCALHDLDQVVYELIALGRERLKRSPTETNAARDLLTLLLLAYDESGSVMTDKQLRDEVITLLLAGHETTALNLSWTWYLLAQHPKAEERLHRELDAVIGQRSPTVGDLQKLAYTDRVLREALRLYPPAWRILRMTSEPLAVADYILPAGANIVISQWVTQRDPRWFCDPDQFNPDRWGDESAAKRPHFAYFPFGGGPRVCIGAGFALMEASLLLAAIARRFRLRLVPNQRIEPLPSITLRPKHGVFVELEERKGAEASTSVN